MARVFCLPSELEGFGIVIAEALALGTPVVCTEIPCLKEVAQDAAVTVPIRDEKSLAVALERVLTRRKLRIELKQEGLRRVQAFDWDTIIKNIEYQYKSLQR